MAFRGALRLSELPISQSVSAAITRNSLRRHPGGSWDDGENIKMWMCPAAQPVSIFFQRKCDPGKSVVPYQIDLIAGPHLPIRRAPSARCRTFNGANEKAIFF